MELIKVIIRDKLFYVVLVIIAAVSSAMNFNESNNADLLAEYYQSEKVIDTLDIESEEEKQVLGMTLRDSLVQYAMTLQGRPYKYAGKGPEVFDCSGFTCYVYKRFNVQLPASSTLQSKFGAETATKDVQKGDLLIFKSPTTGVNRVGHVGLVVSNANGKINFIHSSTRRGVIVDSLNHKHYKARYLGARRVLTD
ncbi:C40 family peptidase [Fulvivirga sp. 29W222]|uniref:C40 family peptidase n=1 Tax=Fulvivirga marina TaxID=2494733 RepID=A0A937FVN0_9BACT|nr:C40 family peptidase [Fulvivirga marina]MBL6445185.1 C40 family peptidase [Fulvivirga marina]